MALQRCRGIAIYPAIRTEGGWRSCCIDSGTGKEFPAPDAVGFGGEWGYYTDDETDPVAGGPPTTQLRGPPVLCGYRYYDPNTRRFLTRDPVDYAAGINLYLYCDGNPINCFDPLGLDVTIWGCQFSWGGIKRGLTTGLAITGHEVSFHLLPAFGQENKPGAGWSTGLAITGREAGIAVLTAGLGNALEAVRGGAGIWRRLRHGSEYTARRFGASRR